MPRIPILTVAGVLALAPCVLTEEPRLRYPLARRGDLVEEYHGHKVADPYRWLEDADTPESRAWIEAENALSSGFLERIPARTPIRERLTRLWNYERYSLPFFEGGRYFYSKNDGLQNQAVLYTVDSLDGEPRVLLDPNQLSKDGTVALAGTSVSDDGRLLAYGIAEAGSDWNVWKVRDVSTGLDLPDEIRHVKFSGAAWTKDGKGFFYGRFDAPKPGADLKGVNRFQKIYHHLLGTAQEQDRLVYERPDRPDWYLNPGVTDDGSYLVILASDGSTDKNGIFYKDLRDPRAEVVALLDRFDARYLFVDNEAGVFFVKTDEGAPRGRVVAVELARPGKEHWRTLIPEGEESLQAMSLVGDRFFASYLKDAKTVVRLFDATGKPRGEVSLPGPGTAVGFQGKRKQTETFYGFTGFTTPTTIYRYDVASGDTAVFKKPSLDFAAEDYVTSQVFYPSKDGTRVPMFLTHRKGLRLDGTNPTLLYGYGGFNISLTPGFSVSPLLFLERGGVYAVANLRGGGEYGEGWHEAGTRLRKQNVFDDFIAAAEWLIANSYTSSARLAIQGASNGGLLVGAAITQRPELFGAALPAVGVMDMLRFHKFTVGWGWVGDYGSPDDPEQFKALYAYSPYHNLKPGTCYPPTLVTTGDHDDRVFPAHSFKFAAALQHAQGCAQPALIRIETRAGHGAGKPTQKRIEEAADQLAFLVHALGMDGGR